MTKDERAFIERVMRDGEELERECPNGPDCPYCTFRRMAVRHMLDTMTDEDEIDEAA